MRPIRIVLLVVATVVVLIVVGFGVSYLLFASGDSGPVLVTTGLVTTGLGTTGTGTAP